MTTNVTHLCLRPGWRPLRCRWQRGCLPFGGSMVEVPRVDWILLFLSFLSLGLGFASILPVRFHKEGSGLVPMQGTGSARKISWQGTDSASRATLLAPDCCLLGLGGRRLTLMLHEMNSFPPTHRVCCSPVRQCHSRCCARTSVFGLIRSITGKQQTTQGPSIRMGTDT